MKSSPWFRVDPMHPGDDAARTRLITFSHAGGSASSFNPWNGRFPAHVQLVRTQLPGREEHTGEPFRSVYPLAERLAIELSPLLDRPFAFYGHSQGALVAFEVVRALRTRRAPLPALLCVASRRAPHLPLSRPRLHAISDDELAAYLKRMGGANADLFDRPSWRRHFFPTMRADLEMSDLYEYQSGLPLPIPVLAFWGLDDPSVDREELIAWRDHTSAGFRAEFLSGRHFFDDDGRARQLRLLQDVIGSSPPFLAPKNPCEEERHVLE